MAFEAPTQSEIRTAKRQAVGGGRKRCRKGKNCSAACIAGDMACLVEMPESAGIATTKVAGMLQQRSGGGAAAASPTTQDKIVKLQERIKEAQEKGDKKQLAYLRHSLQGLQRNLKVETQALKEGRPGCA